MSRPKLILMFLSLVLLVCTASVSRADTITFAPLAGANGALYVGHVESGYTVTATAGAWREAQNFGNPVPSIFSIAAGGTAAIDVTGPGLFTFSSADLASLTGAGSFLFQGFVGAANVFTFGGAIASVNVFTTFNNTFSAVAINRLVISMIPGPNTSSMNVDNITVFGVTTVPEPMTMLLFGTGLVGIAAKLRKRKAA